MKIVTRKEARFNLEKKYYTGKPCLRGHLSERFVLTAGCIECDVENKKRRKNDE